MSQRKKLVRANFREAVFTRDNHCCKKCGATDNLDAHHITDRTLMPNGGYHVSNGITLCPTCHEKAEEFHSSGGTKWDDGWHPSDLYSLIHSSYDIAHRNSQRI